MQVEEGQYAFVHKMAKTARVWAIANELSQQTGQLAKRKDVIEKYKAEGGNVNTASTQYTLWKADYMKGETGYNLQENAGNVPPTRLIVGKDGRLLIPASLRAAMRLDPSGIVTAQVVDGELRVITPACALKTVQDMVARSDHGSGSVVDELISERRADAAAEG